MAKRFRRGRTRRGPPGQAVSRFTLACRQVLGIPCPSVVLQIPPPEIGAVWGSSRQSCLRRFAEQGTRSEPGSFFEASAPLPCH